MASNELFCAATYKYFETCYADSVFHLIVLQLCPQSFLFLFHTNIYRNYDFTTALVIGISRGLKKKKKLGHVAAGRAEFLHKARTPCFLSDLCCTKWGTNLAVTRRP